MRIKFSTKDTAMLIGHTIYTTENRISVGITIPPTSDLTMNDLTQLIERLTAIRTEMHESSFWLQHPWTPLDHDLKEIDLPPSETTRMVVFVLDPDNIGAISVEDIYEDYDRDRLILLFNRNREAFAREGNFRISFEAVSISDPN
jgi:hypothetical protein